MKRYFISLFLAFHLFSSFSQENKWDGVDEQIEELISTGQLISAQELALQHFESLKMDKADTLIPKFYFAVALGLMNRDEPRSLLYLDSAIDSSEKTEFQSMHFRSLNAKSTLLRRLGRYEEARSVSESVFKNAKANRGNSLFESSRSLGIIYRELGRHDSALYYMITADTLAQQSPNEYLKYLTLQGIANIYEHMGDYTSAISKNYELLKLCKRDYSFLNTWLNLGRAYLGIDELDSAKICFTKSLAFASEVQDTVEMANLHSQLAEISLLQGRYQEAQNEVRKTLFMTSIDDPSDILVAAKVIDAEVERKTGNYLGAIKSAEEVLVLAKELGLKKQEIKLLEILSFSHYQIDNLGKAYSYLHEYEAVKSVFNEQGRMAKIEELKARYETEARKREMGELLKENKIKDLEISQQKIFFFVAVAFSILVFALGVVLFRQLKLRAQQKQIALEQTLLRSQMNPHFIFNALTSIQNYILGKDEVNASKYLAKFGALMRDILESSEKEFISLSQELEMVKNYVQIEETKFGKELSFRINAEVESDEVLVPPMMIQPFIENSIKHGFKNRDSGILDLYIVKKGNELHFNLKDDGEGMQTDRNSTHSLGIKITRQRIEKLNKRRGESIKFGNIVDETKNILGFQVEFNLPLKYAI